MLANTIHSETDLDYRLGVVHVLPGAAKATGSRDDPRLNRLLRRHVRGDYGAFNDDAEGNDRGWVTGVAVLSRYSCDGTMINIRTSVPRLDPAGGVVTTVFTDSDALPKR